MLTDRAALWAVVLIFAGSRERFGKLSVEDYRQRSLDGSPANESSVQAERRVEEFRAGSVKSFDEIRESWIRSGAWIAGALVFGGGGGLLLSCGPVSCSGVLTLLSVFLVVWPTLGSLGWGIMTACGKTLPERAEQAFLRVFTLCGLVLSAGLVVSA